MQQKILLVRQDMQAPVSHVGAAPGFGDDAMPQPVLSYTRTTGDEDLYPENPNSTWGSMADLQMNDPQTVFVDVGVDPENTERPGVNALIGQIFRDCGLRRGGTLIHKVYMDQPEYELLTEIHNGFTEVQIKNLSSKSNDERYFVCYGYLADDPDGSKQLAIDYLPEPTPGTTVYCDTTQQQPIEAPVEHSAFYSRYKLEKAEKVEHVASLFASKHAKNIRDSARYRKYALHEPTFPNVKKMYELYNNFFKINQVNPRPGTSPVMEYRTAVETYRLMRDLLYTHREKFYGSADYFFGEALMHNMNHVIGKACSWDKEQMPCFQSLQEREPQTYLRAYNPEIWRHGCPYFPETADLLEGKPMRYIRLLKPGTKEGRCEVETEHSEICRQIDADFYFTHFPDPYTVEEAAVDRKQHYPLMRSMDKIGTGSVHIAFTDIIPRELRTGPTGGTWKDKFITKGLPVPPHFTAINNKDNKIAKDFFANLPENQRRLIGEECGYGPNFVNEIEQKFFMNDNDWAASLQHFSMMGAQTNDVLIDPHLYTYVVQYCIRDVTLDLEDFHGAEATDQIALNNAATAGFPFSQMDLPTLRSPLARPLFFNDDETYSLMAQPSSLCCMTTVMHLASHLATLFKRQLKDKPAWNPGIISTFGKSDLMPIEKKGRVRNICVANAVSQYIAELACGDIATRLTKNGLNCGIHGSASPLSRGFDNIMKKLKMVGENNEYLPRWIFETDCSNRDATYMVHKQNSYAAFIFNIIYPQGTDLLQELLFLNQIETDIATYVITKFSELVRKLCGNISGSKLTSLFNGGSGKIEATYTNLWLDFFVEPLSLALEDNTEPTYHVPNIQPDDVDDHLQDSSGDDIIATSTTEPDFHAISTVYKGHFGTIIKPSACKKQYADADGCRFVGFTFKRDIDNKIINAVFPRDRILAAILNFKGSDLTDKQTENILRTGQYRWLNVNSYLDGAHALQTALTAFNTELVRKHVQSFGPVKAHMKLTKLEEKMQLNLPITRLWNEPEMKAMFTQHMHGSSNAQNHAKYTMMQGLKDAYAAGGTLCMSRAAGSKSILLRIMMESFAGKDLRVEHCDTRLVKGETCFQPKCDYPIFAENDVNVLSKIPIKHYAPFAGLTPITLWDIAAPYLEESKEWDNFELSSLYKTWPHKCSHERGCTTVDIGAGMGFMRLGCTVRIESDPEHAPTGRPEYIYKDVNDVTLAEIEEKCLELGYPPPCRAIASMSLNQIMLQGYPKLMEHFNVQAVLRFNPDGGYHVFVYRNKTGDEVSRTYMGPDFSVFVTSKGHRAMERSIDLKTIPGKIYQLKTGEVTTTCAIEIPKRTSLVSQMLEKIQHTTKNTSLPNMYTEWARFMLENTVSSPEDFERLGVILNAIREYAVSKVPTFNVAIKAQAFIVSRGLHPRFEEIQRSAFQTVRRERLVYIEGPPGTGKTTAIANFIASSKNEKTLLVCSQNAPLKAASAALVQCKVKHNYIVNAGEDTLAMTRDDRSNVTLITFDKFIVRAARGKIPLDHVNIIVDEGSQTASWYLMAVLGMYKHKLNTLVVVGDKHQNSPYGELGKIYPSAIDHAIILGATTVHFPYCGRCPPQVVQAMKVTNYPYIQQLCEHDGTVKVFPFSNDCAFSGDSRYNKANVDLVKLTLDVEKTCQIVTPYMAQVELYRRCGYHATTITASQGSEWDFVILDLVDANDNQFAYNMQALNVGATRAKKTLYVLAGANVAKQHPYLVALTTKAEPQPGRNIQLPKVTNDSTVFLQEEAEIKRVQQLKGPLRYVPHTSRVTAEWVGEQLQIQPFEEFVVRKHPTAPHRVGSGNRRRHCRFYVKPGIKAWQPERGEDISHLENPHIESDRVIINTMAKGNYIPFHRDMDDERLSDVHIFSYGEAEITIQHVESSTEFTFAVPDRHKYRLTPRLQESCKHMVRALTDRISYCYFSV